MMTFTEQDPRLSKNFYYTKSYLKAILKIELHIARRRVRSHEDYFSDPSYLWEIGSAPLLTFILS